MKRSEQNRNNYGINPQNRNRSMGTSKGINRNNFNNSYDQYASGARNSEWNNTDEHFSFDHDNNYDTSSKYNDYNSSYNNRGEVNGNRNPNLGVSSNYNFNGFTSNHGTDFDDEGLETRSHRMNNQGWDRSGMRSSNPGMRGDSYGQYGKGPKGYKRSDDRIKEDVSEALYVHSEIDASNIEVSVKDGSVTLSGTVESRDLKRQVESAIENLSGVDDVQNDLKVAKSTESRASSLSSSSTSIRNSKLA